MPWLAVIILVLMGHPWLAMAMAFIIIVTGVGE